MTQEASLRMSQDLEALRRGYSELEGTVSALEAKVEGLLALNRDEHRPRRSSAPHRIANMRTSVQAPARG